MNLSRNIARTRSMLDRACKANDTVLVAQYTALLLILQREYIQELEKGLKARKAS